MSHQDTAPHTNDDQTLGRRRQLRQLLLAAANTAREGRRRDWIGRAVEPVGRAVRERVSMLLSAAA